MNNRYQEAKDKLEREKKAASYDRHGNVMKDAVAKALIGFCGQNEIFAEKVIRGGSFEECMKAVSKNVGTSLSDAEAYRRAVAFYWPGTEIRVQMEIVEKTKPHPSAALIHSSQGEGSAKNTIIDFTDFL